MKRALVLLNKCTETAPSIANAHYWTGKIHQCLGDSNAALDAYDQALIAHPGAFHILLEASVAAFSLEMYDTALSLTEIGAKVRPGSAEVRFNLAVSYLLRGRVEDALIEIRASDSLGPDDHVTQMLLTLIERVANGTVPCPGNHNELQSALRSRTPTE